MEVNPNAIHETNRLRLAIDKAVAELNWCPKWSARTAVERAALWYRRFFDCGSRQTMREQSLDDIQHYNQSPRT
jgi:hypothetical protein